MRRIVFDDVELQIYVEGAAFRKISYYGAEFLGVNFSAVIVFQQNAHAHIIIYFELFLRCKNDDVIAHFG